MMRYLWVLIVTGLISLGLSGNVWAANWNSGSQGTQKSDYKDPQVIIFPKDFFVEKIKGNSCYGSGAWNQEPLSNGMFDLLIQDEVSKLTSIDSKTLEDTSTSLTVNHDYISRKWALLLDLTYDAVASENQSKIEAVKDILVSMAKNRVLLGATKPEEHDGQCWKDGNQNAKCKIHFSLHSGYTFVAAMISAIVLEEHITAQEKKMLDEYFSESYERYIRPLTLGQLKSKGLYEFADYGIGVLAYARWTKDEKLAKLELKRRYFSFLQKIEDDGFLKENSYRGYRGYWYHTLGVEGVFAYSMIARNFGVDFFNMPLLKAKFSKIVEKTVQGNSDVLLFEKLPKRGKNRITDKSKARPHMHQLAINLPTVLENEFKVTIVQNPIYLRKSKDETVSRFVGFNADCYYQSIKQ